MTDWTPTGSGSARPRTFYRGDGSAIPVAYEALREQAQLSMSAPAKAFVGGGAGSGSTVAENRAAFDRWQLVPRVLRDMSDRALGVEAFGRQLAAPIMAAPIGAQSVIHDDGESAVAAATADLDVPFALSTASSTTLEDIADILGSTPKVFQLYVASDDRLTASLLDRAESAGYDAIMVTVDMPLRGWIEAELEAGAFPPADGHGLANYLSDPVFSEALEGSPEADMDAAIDHYLSIASDPGMTWSTIEDITSMTDLPVIVKGVLHPDDAVRAAEIADGVVVSNHGGRSLDGSIAALSALPDIADAIDDGLVVFDSGIRRGTDVLKALALGADIVMVGRPYVYGLAVAGETGVREVFKNLLADLDIAMAQTGQSAIADLDRSLLRRAT